jgi:hypothetical protein
VVFGQRSQLWWGLPLAESFALLRTIHRVSAADHARRLEECVELLEPCAARSLRRQQALTANIVSHRVSAAYLLGDAGTALAHAHSLPLAAIPIIEGHARLLVDVAMCYAQWDKPDLAYQTLLIAETHRTR